MANAYQTRHRASTSMYSLTFCVRFLLPERHQWKARIRDCRSNVENAPRRRPVAGGPAAPACRMRRAVLGVPPRHPRPATSVAGRRRAQTPPSRRFALCRHIAGWTQAWNWGSRYVAIATQPVPRLQIRPIVHN